MPTTATAPAARWWQVVGGVLVAAVATLLLPGTGVPGAWDIVVALWPDESAPAFGLAIAGLIGALAGLAARAVGRHTPIVAAALSGALAAFLLAPAPLDPSSLPFALLGLVYLRRHRRSASPANDNATLPAPGFSWVPVASPHDSLTATTSVR